MSIKEYKTRVTFVTDKETHQRLKTIVKQQRRNGNKATVSSMLNELVRQHVEAHDLFKAIPAE